MLAASLLLAAALFVAYANGANDNFKGVATLYGSGRLGYRSALAWGTLTTLAGSLCSVLLAGRLVEAFSARGLVPEAVAGTPELLAATALGAAATVFLATVTGFPISTTHALTGGLLGAGLVAAGRSIDAAVLGTTFFLPLLASPLLAIGLGSIGYPLLRRGEAVLDGETCLCAGATPRVAAAPGGALAASATLRLELAVDHSSECARRFPGRFLGVRLAALLDVVHVSSAGVVSFARGLNDTPKIVGLLVALEALDARVSLGAVALAMAAGGLLQAGKVAHTLSKRITPLDPGRGLTANLVTSLLVLAASGGGLPVSTTHVSCGALFGVGLATRRADLRTSRQILASWFLTLPLAAILAALSAVTLFTFG